MQELEELVKEKEKDLEKVEEKGCSLIQGKKGDAAAVVMETLKGLNQAWTNLDQMVSSRRGEAPWENNEVLDKR